MIKVPKIIYGMEKMDSIFKILASGVTQWSQLEVNLEQT